MRAFQDTTHTDILTDPRVILALVEIAEANRPSAALTPLGPRHGWLAALGRAWDWVVDRVRGRGGAAQVGARASAARRAQAALDGKRVGLGRVAPGLALPAWMRRGPVVQHAARKGRVKFGAEQKQAA